MLLFCVNVIVLRLSSSDILIRKSCAVLRSAVVCNHLCFIRLELSFYHTLSWLTKHIKYVVFRFICCVFLCFVELFRQIFVRVTVRLHHVCYYRIDFNNIPKALGAAFAEVFENLSPKRRHRIINFRALYLPAAVVNLNVHGLWELSLTPFFAVYSFLLHLRLDLVLLFTVGWWVVLSCCTSLNIKCANLFCSHITNMFSVFHANVYSWWSRFFCSIKQTWCAARALETFSSPVLPLFITCWTKFVLPLLSTLLSWRFVSYISSCLFVLLIIIITCKDVEVSMCNRILKAIRSWSAIYF